MMVAILGTANAQVMAAPRILVAMARDGLFPHQATIINAGGTPVVALAISLLLTGATLFTGSFSFILGVDSFFIVSLYLVNFSALFALRRKEPDTPRPYRAWGYPVVPALAFIIAALLLLAMTLGDTRGALITVGMMLVSWPVSKMVGRVRGSS